MCAVVTARLSSRIEIGRAVSPSSVLRSRPRRFHESEKLDGFPAVDRHDPCPRSSLFLDFPCHAMDEQLAEQWLTEASCHSRLDRRKDDLVSNGHGGSGTNVRSATAIVRHGGLRPPRSDFFVSGHLRMVHVEAEEIVLGIFPELRECRWITVDTPVSALGVVEPIEPDDIR